MCTFSLTFCSTEFDLSVLAKCKYCLNSNCYCNIFSSLFTTSTITIKIQCLFFIDLLTSYYNIEFMQQDGRKKRVAKCLCVTNVTGMLLMCFVVIFT